jgi:N6-L-threonylcarbamoyladenine synthase
MSKKLYLAIETSCDETSLALLEGDIGDRQSHSFYDFLNSFQVLSSVISSQIDIHAMYGGVVPEIGARQHADHIHLLFKSLLSQVTKDFSPDIELSDSEKDLLNRVDKIFVTGEPGLVSALRVGIEFAKTVSFFIGIQSNQPPEVIKVNHLKGHTTSSFYKPSEKKSIPDTDLFPHLHLLVSGGNSQLILMNSWSDWQIVGQTLDDAAGECLDKVGRMVGLPYPGGVYLAKIASYTDENVCNFPVSMKNDPNLNYSFSGLKTAVRYFLQDLEVADFKFEENLTDQEYKNLLEKNFDSSSKLQLVYNTCISAQSVVVTQLINKLEKGSLEFKPKSIGLSGGVSANLLLRSHFETLQKKHQINHVFFPNLALSGDNAIMIALAGLLGQN